MTDLDEIEKLAREISDWKPEDGWSRDDVIVMSPENLREFARRLTAPQPGAAVPEGMSLLVDALEGAMIESLHGEGFDLWAKNRGKLRNRLPENVGAIVVKMRALLAAPAPEAEKTPRGGGNDLLYRINTYGLVGGLTDAEFRQNVEPILEDVRGWLLGSGYVPDVWPGSEIECDSAPSSPAPEAHGGEAGAQSLAEMCAAGRAHKGWTLRQAEAETGVSNALISQIETGKQDNPTLRVLKALTRAYGLNPSSVLGLIAHPAPPAAGQPEGVEALIAQWREDAKNHDMRGRVICASMCEGHALELETSLASAPQSNSIIGWVYEDQLPDGYPYDEMFPHSKVDGVRMFPVFGPPQSAGSEEMILLNVTPGYSVMAEATEKFTSGSEQQGECAGVGDA